MSNPVGLIFKAVTHLGQLASDLKDFEKAAEDLFSGKLTREDVEALLKDVVELIGGGFISIPGMDQAALVSFIQGSESVVDDVIQGVSDIQLKGVSAVTPDLKKIVGDLISCVESGVIRSFGGVTKEQVLEVLRGINSAL